MVARHQKVKKSSMDTEDKVTRKLKLQSACMVGAIAPILLQNEKCEQTILDERQLRPKSGSQAIVPFLKARDICWTSQLSSWTVFSGLVVTRS